MSVETLIMLENIAVISVHVIIVQFTVNSMHTHSRYTYMQHL